MQSVHQTGFSSWKKVVMIAVLMIASLIPLWSAILHNGYLNDDVFITLTYVKNLWAGNGFVYNYPPPVQGTTTPLLTLLLVLLKFLLPAVPIPTLDIFLSALCWLGVVWLFYFFRYAWELEDWQVLILGLVLIASGSIELLGMEVYLFFFLLVLTASLFNARKYYGSGLSAGLLFLTRGEGILVLGALFAFHLYSAWKRDKRLISLNWRPILQMLIGFAVPVLIWLIYAQFTFGSVLPNTLFAKQAQGEAGRTLPLLGRLIYDWAPAWGVSLSLTSIPYLNFWWLLVLTGVITTIIRKHKWLIFLIWIFLYILGYTWLGVATYWWYQIPIVFIAQIFLALGLIEVVDWVHRMGTLEKLGAIRPLFPVLAIVLVTLVILFLGRFHLSKTLTYQGDSRGESYTRLSQWLQENTEPTDSVAFVEIGYLGFYTQNRIIDLEGLILPDILPHIAQSDLAWGFWHYQPDYYVYLPDFEWVLTEINSDPRFLMQYQPIAELPGPHQANFIIYRRKSVN